MDAQGVAIDVSSEVSGPAAADRLAEFSLTQSLLHEPFEYYDTLRDELPVFYSRRDRCYVLSRYQDVRALLQDYELYDSRLGSMQSRKVEKGELDFDPIFLQSPPEHTRLRKLGAKAYSIASAASIEASCHVIATDVLGALGGSFDLISDYAEPVALRSISTFLDIPPDGAAHLQGVLRQLFSRSATGTSDEPTEALGRCIAGHFFAAKQGKVSGFPRDILTAEVNGETFSNGEAFGMLMLAAIGGAEDMVRAIGHVVYALSEYREQRQILLQDLNGRMNAAIAEALRLYPTTHYLRRVTTQEVTLHGVTLATGANVVGLLGAANRDERVFEDAAEFQLDRSNTSASLSFGTGPHVCIGKNVAKVILKAALVELLKRHPDYELDLSQSRRVHNAPIVGYESLRFIGGAYG